MSTTGPLPEVDREGPIGAVQRCLVSCRLVFFPAKSSLVGQSEPQQEERRHEANAMDRLGEGLLDSRRQQWGRARDRK